MTTERRELFPRDVQRAGQTSTIAPGDRREIFTELEHFCRYYHSPAAISRHRSRSRLAVWQDLRYEPASADPIMLADEQSNEFRGDAPPASIHDLP